MGKNFRETLNKQLVANERFREEFEALAPEYEITKMLIESRKSRNLTQKQLAELRNGKRITCTNYAKLISKKGLTIKKH